MAASIRFASVFEPVNNASKLDHHDFTADVVRALTLYCFAEFQLGHATTICVTAAENSFTVADDGRGHAINRTVDGAAYLKFIYTHFEYPFATGHNAPVQLQGIGMSLINALCSELVVTVRKQTLRLEVSFQNGRASGHELINVTSDGTGIAISGTVSAQVQRQAVEVQALQRWLQQLLSGSPSLKLFFNGDQLQALPQSNG